MCTATPKSLHKSANAFQQQNCQSQDENESENELENDSFAIGTRWQFCEKFLVFCVGEAFLLQVLS